MIIIGAGMAGLLAANMLRRFQPVIHEAQPSLPHNHDAVLRFRSDAVSRVTGIPFRKVTVNKGIFYKNEVITRPDLRLNNMYAAKVTGQILSRSILNLEPVERWIAPPDFIAQMASSVSIRFNAPFVGPLPESGVHPIISTIPMPALMALSGWKAMPIFRHERITTLTCTIEEPDVDVYQTLYYPGAEPWYRVSITGRHVAVELMGGQLAAMGVIEGDKMGRHMLVNRILSDFGIQATLSDVIDSEQKFGKIVPVDDDTRKQFILAMTDLHRIYSVGRFATWRQLLLDDVVQDIRLVQTMVAQRSSYEQRLFSANN